MTSEVNDKESEDQSKDKPILPHHVQLDLCRTRPAYRQGRDLKAVKTYSITSESNHLLVFGVPKVKLRPEIKVLLQKYGKILSLTVKNYNPMEEFTECFHVVYERFQSARVAKKCLDTRSFYGGLLHICYAPELETVDETKRKMIQRFSYVRKQVAINNSKDVQQKIFIKANDDNKRAISQCSSVINDYSLHNQYINSYESNIAVQNDYSYPSTSFEPVSNSYNYDIASQALDITGKCDTEDSINNKRPHNSEDNKEYVFKRKKKNKKGNKKLLNSINELKNVIEESKIEGINDRNELNDNELGTVVVYDKLEIPRIVNVPKKTANQIIMKINTKLI